MRYAQTPVSIPNQGIMNELLKIFRLDTEEAQKISSSPDEPHHHNFEELIIALEGELEHFGMEQIK